MRHRDAERAPHAEQVDLDHPLERGAVHRAHESGGRDARVGDDDVDAAEVLDHALGDALEVVPAGHVGFPGLRVRSDPLGDRLLFAGLEADERDLGSARGEPLGQAGLRSRERLR